MKYEDWFNSLPQEIQESLEDWRLIQIQRTNGKYIMSRMLQKPF